MTASSAMKRRSQPSAMGTAIPAQAPLTAAMTGLAQAMRYVYSPSRSGGRSTASAASGAGSGSRSSVGAAPSVMVVRSPRSAPAQNARPAPVITMPTTARSASARATAWRTSAPMRVVQALRRSGRCSVMVATGSTTS